jgi:hypothetical protein
MYFILKQIEHNTHRSRGIGVVNGGLCLTGVG